MTGQARVASEQNLAEAVVNTLVAADAKVNALLGITFVRVSAREAVCRLEVKEQHLNSHDVCHGGILFALADTTLAYANCSTNRRGMSLSANIIYVKAARLGDVITATADVVLDGRSASASTVRLINQRDELIAVFQGSGIRFDKAILESPVT